ncbi:hypothetical protein M0805_000402 [Coniferiporia weirii]|nr:hypothetical protein M0805_000402 [Coniferiporia weirii]
MATMTQTQTALNPHTPPPSPTRKRFSYMSPTRAVVSIIAPKRRSSQIVFPSMHTPPQRRSVSNPERAAAPTESESVPSDKESDQPPTSPTSPPASVAARSLTFPHVANIFVKLRRVQKKVKAHHIESTSGPEPITHPSLLTADDAEGTHKRRARLEVQDVFTCADAVDVPRLLRASRASLLDRASLFHANVLVDEHWSCSICGPKHRSDGSYRVLVRYTATAACSTLRESRQPVALEQVKGVEGLMTITNREIASTNVVEVFQES